MTFWDIFTWLMIVTLAVSAIVIFALFMKDVRGVLKGQEGRVEDGQRKSPPGSPPT
jgi:hypothetical protein